MSTADGPSPYRRLLERAFSSAIPLNCQIEITYRCNHLCSFCYNSPTGESEMTTPQIFEALRKISDFGVLYVTLTGGEAMCHRDFWAIAREVRRRDMALRVYTNGFLLADPRNVQRLRELDPIEVEVSVHGARPETHDALTCIQGSFHKTWQAVRNLVDSGIRVNLKCPITKRNQDELFDVRDLGERHGLRVNFDAVIVPKDDGDLAPLALRADEEFIRKYWVEWYSELHRGKLPPRANHCASDGVANCGTGRSGFTVDPYGNILPCVAFRRKVANILEIDSLAQIWRSSPVLEEVRDLSVEARKRLDGHEDGQYFTFCLGVAETQVGDPLALYPQAEVNAKAVRRHYELLQIQDPETSAKSA